MWLPTNDDTRTIVYDTKFLKSSEGRYPPLRWTITKIEDTAVNGISRFTLAQDQFDPAKDNAKDMIANYYDSFVEPELPERVETPIANNLEIVYSGTPVVRAGGGYKKFSLQQYANGNLEDVTDTITWYIGDVMITGTKDAPQKIAFGGNPKGLTCEVKDNSLKVKCKDDYSLVTKTFVIDVNSDYGSKSVTVEVISL